jgi:cytoskeleton protein RodZ
VFEIGNSLRDARLRRDLDFPELEQGTKIRAKYLRALEEENFEQLPASTYIKGFLRAYADYLGLDGQLYVDEYNVRYGSGDDVLERRVRRGRAASRRTTERHRRLESNVVWFALAGIAAVTALVIAAWRFGGGGKPSPPASPPRATAAAPARVRGLVVKAVHGSTLLIVRAGSDSGRQLWNGTLSPGKSQRFGAARGLWIYMGSPENVEMRLNGRAVVVGGSKPRSLIVTAGGIVPAGPGT